MGITRSTLAFASGTVLSRITGLIRDQVVLAIFGASALMDAFVVAFRIPNLFRDMLAEGSLGSAFTKVYSQTKTYEEQRARELLREALGWGGVFLICLSLMGFWIAPAFVDLMTLRAGPAEKASLLPHAVGLTQLLFPYLGLTVLGAIAGGALYEKGRFFASALSPVGFNLLFMAGALVFAPLGQHWLPDWLDHQFADRSLVGLALGVLAGGLLQAGLQLYWCREQLKGVGHRFSFRMSKEMKEVLVLMAPASLAASTGPINLVVNTNFATSVGEGAMTWLVYAFRLVQLPVGVFGVAVGVVVLPQLSRLLASKQNRVDQEVGDRLSEGLALVFWLMAFAMVFLFVLGEPLVQALFQHGQFAASDSFATAQALRAYSFAIMGYGSMKVLQAFYYAVHRTQYALVGAVLGVLVNFIGNWLLVDHYGHEGLALTSAMTITLNFLWLLGGIRRYSLKGFYRSIFRNLMELGGLCGALVLLSNGFGPFLAPLWESMPHPLNALSRLVGEGLILFVLFVGATCVRQKRSPQSLLMRLKRSS